jgi:hypothetical protein
MEFVTALFRYFWFVVLGMVLLNARFMRGRVDRLVSLGRVTPDEAEGFLRGFTFALAIPCIALGLITLWADWPSPLCAGVFSFRDTPSAASSVVILAAWGALLLWVWAGSGADLLGRMAPALIDPPIWERTFSPAVVRTAVTAVLLAAGIGAAVIYRSMPPDAACLAPGVAA